MEKTQEQINQEILNLIKRMSERQEQIRQTLNKLDELFELGDNKK
jgi:flagellar capping protein FliD